MRHYVLRHTEYERPRKHAPNRIDFGLDAVQRFERLQRHAQRDFTSFSQLETSWAALAQLQAKARFDIVDMSADRRLRHRQRAFRRGKSARPGGRAKHTQRTQIAFV